MLNIAKFLNIWFCDLTKTKQKADYNDQPLNGKCIELDWWEKQDLCLWISSRPDSAWPETSEAYIPRVKLPNHFLFLSLFFLD